MGKETQLDASHPCHPSCLLGHDGLDSQTVSPSKVFPLKGFFVGCVLPAVRRQLIQNVGRVLALLNLATWFFGLWNDLAEAIRKGFGTLGQRNPTM